VCSVRAKALLTAHLRISFPAKGRSKAPFLCALAYSPVGYIHLALRRAGRKPMFQFEFDRTLFRFNAKTPAFEPLFQLPPRRGSRYSLAPQDFLHPPTILPISTNNLLQFSYLLKGRNSSSFASLM